LSARIGPTLPFQKSYKRAANIRLGLKKLTTANTLVYYYTEINPAAKFFYSSGAWFSKIIPVLDFLSKNIIQPE
jgi:hypothetical protein